MAQLISVKLGIWIHFNDYFQAATDVNIEGEDAKEI